MVGVVLQEVQELVGVIACLRLLKQLLGDLQQSENLAAENDC